MRRYATQNISRALQPLKRLAKVTRRYATNRCHPNSPLDARNRLQDYDVALVTLLFTYPKGVPMKVRLLLVASICALFIFSFANTTSSAKHSTNSAMAKTQSGSPTEQKPPRDEKLWQRALEIQRKAIVIDSHNDITTPMTNDDYDLSGAPPVPYRTSIDRMKEGGHDR